MGGTPLTGGQVKILGTVAGALLLQFMTATLVKHNVPDAYSQIVQAAIILVAVYIQRGRIFGAMTDPRIGRRSRHVEPAGPRAHRGRRTELWRRHRAR